VAFRVTEIPFFFERGSAKLFGILHKPEQATDKTAFVMSHPFGEEKLWAHRVFVSMARELAKRGHAVLRFDYMGAGDSSGTTPDTSLESHLADLVAAVETLTTRVPTSKNVGLIGLRLGASFAALLAEQAATDDRLHRIRNAPLILWEPVLDGLSYFQELLRSNLSTQLAVYGKVREDREVLQQSIRAGGRVNVDGYEIAQPLFESCARTDLLAAATKQHAGPVLVAQLAATSAQKDRADLQSLVQHYQRGTFVRATEQPFWREIKPFTAHAANLQQATLQWLEQNNA
jgi:exosortase A-associated hydrolase 2